MGSLSYHQQYKNRLTLGMGFGGVLIPIIGILTVLAGCGDAQVSIDFIFI